MVRLKLKCPMCSFPNITDPLKLSPVQYKCLGCGTVLLVAMLFQEANGEVNIALKVAL